MRGSLPLPYYDVHYPLLKDLVLKDSLYPSSPLADADLYTKLPPLMYLNSTIQNLHIYSVNVKPTTQFWQAVGTECVNAQRLLVYGRTLAPDAMESFWYACTRFTAIVLSRVEIDTSTIPQNINLSRIKCIQIYNSARDVIDFGINEYVPLFRACSELIHLSWTLRDVQPYIQHFMMLPDEAAMTNTLRKLECLRLHGNAFMDRDIAALLRNAPLVRRLENNNTWFGLDAFDTLKNHHFRQMEALVMVECNGLKSVMVQRVLCSCPQLKQLVVGTVFAADIVLPSNPWICCHLERLEMRITKRENDLKEWELEIFERLSNLTALRHLDLGTCEAVPGPLRSLDLTLNAGLGLLARLRGLAVFGFVATPQAMDRLEIDWMLESWPRLHTVTGTLTGDALRNKLLGDLLKEKNVRYSPFALVHQSNGMFP
ncbi:hypothetical protein BGZ72_008925 [Mortierella alpina]|nr:hypothetical protein BGZ72_008925 [Mortierella alpina]